MSEVRVAFVVEGATDRVIIQAALQAILPEHDLVPTVLQPEATNLKFGGGWGGVLKWCSQTLISARGSISSDPLLELYDLLVIHVDADVTRFSYAQCGPEVEGLAIASGWHALPDVQDCPPAEASADCMRDVLSTWLGRRELGPKVVLCVPSMSIEAWLAAAVTDRQSVLDDIECAEIGPRLENLPKRQRIKKRRDDYEAQASTVVSRWPIVRRRCTSAETFHQAMVNWEART